jgi:predicted acylesterase/phospholipase RssA
MPKRALILAGGGLKVCYQAGVLQVWLDEAGLRFDHADGASGGCLNLMMYCQGMSGQQIADNWRTLDPFLPVDVNLSGVWPFGSSLFTNNSLRNRVLSFWKINWDTIRASSLLGTFNVFNFSKKQLEVILQSQMTADYLVASVSLPMWFPPVVIGGNTYFDAVYITDANLQEAVTRGADEIWAIWTVSRRDDWRDGFVNQYFQIIETVADTNFFTFWKRLEDNNERIAAGQPGEFGRPIALNLIQAEVGVHYLINISRDRMAEAVNQGVEDARAWCRARNIPLKPGPVYPPPPKPNVSSVQFTEVMKGFVNPGDVAATKPDYVAAASRGEAADHSVTCRFNVTVPDIDGFVTSPQHAANLSGTIDSPLYGGTRLVDSGVLNLLIDDGDPTRKLMKYRVFFKGADGNDYTFTGFKDISGKTLADMWPETSTLYSRILSGRVAEGDVGNTIASGVIAIRPEDFVFIQLFSFRGDGPTPATAAQALTRFGVMFFGKLWDVYGHQIGP